MKYTYQIKFGGAAYVALYPNSDIEMNGEWETDTMIWREKISELKITKALNSTVYDTLETWFEDKDYFETLILVKVLKNSVEDSVHWFGIKWGKLDKHLCTYTVEPDLYDLWSIYFQSTRDLGSRYTGWSSPGSARFYGVDNYYPFVNTFTNFQFLEDIIKDIATRESGFPSSDVVSSFLWQDDYEDASTVDPVNGLPIDYITNKPSPFKHAALTVVSGKYISGKTLNDVIEWLKLFRVWLFIDSNDKLRFEHVKFFNDKLADNAVDFSSYIKDYNEVWQYDNTAIPIKETLKLKEDDADTDEDFRALDIVYSNIRNRPDAQAIDITSQFYTNLAFFGTDPPDENTLFAAYENNAYKWFNGDMTTFSADINYLILGWGIAGQTCGTSDIEVNISQNHTVSVYADSITSNFDVYFVNRSTGLPISGELNVSSTGLTTGTLTTNANVDDAYLAIEGNSNGAFQGWITSKINGRYCINTVEAVITGDPKANGEFSIGNIIDLWWQEDRYSRSATINGSDYDFNGTQYNLRRDTMKFHYSGVINPLYGFNDGTRVGKVDKWKRSLSTDFYEIDIIYQEDE